jgi:hypothetical protein
MSVETTVKCDRCTTRFIAKGSPEMARKEAEAAGWRVGGGRVKWKDYCPDCTKWVRAEGVHLI